jgi:hypothetical protein
MDTSDPPSNYLIQIHPIINYTQKQKSHLSEIDTDTLTATKMKLGKILCQEFIAINVNIWKIIQAHILKTKIN